MTVALTVFSFQPQRIEHVAALAHFAVAKIGEMVGATAVTLFGFGQAFIRQLGERGVDRARAHPPAAPAATGDLADELVPVHGLFGQDAKQRQPYVAAACSGTTGGAEVRPGQSPEGAQPGGAALELCSPAICLPTPPWPVPTSRAGWRTQR